VAPYRRELWRTVSDARLVHERRTRCRRRSCEPGDLSTVSKQVIAGVLTGSPEKASLRAIEQMDGDRCRPTWGQSEDHAVRGGALAKTSPGWSRPGSPVGQAPSRDRRKCGRSAGQHPPGVRREAANTCRHGSARLAFIPGEVVGCRGGVAELLETSTAAVNSTAACASGRSTRRRRWKKVSAATRPTPAVVDRTSGVLFYL